MSQHRYPFVLCRGDDGTGRACEEREDCARYVKFQRAHGPNSVIATTLRRAFQASYSPCLERIDHRGAECDE